VRFFQTHYFTLFPAQKYAIFASEYAFSRIWPKDLETG
jgi:hypothetical protein